MREASWHEARVAEADTRIAAWNEKRGESVAIVMRYKQEFAECIQAITRIEEDRRKGAASASYS